MLRIYHRLDRGDARDCAGESVKSATAEKLRQYSDVFSKSDSDLGVTGVVTHGIDTGDAAPIRQSMRRYPPAHLQAIDQHVDSMMSQGVIEPATSPWASNLVLVRKKDGSYRCCVDYRPLNAVTRKDAYPLPRIDVCLDAMASARWFSTFDLRSAYHHVLINPADSDKTAFVTVGCTNFEECRLDCVTRVPRFNVSWTLLCQDFIFKFVSFIWIIY